MYSSCSHPRIAMYVSSFAYQTCSLPTWSGLPLSLVFPCPPLSGGQFESHLENSKVMNQHPVRAQSQHFLRGVFTPTLLSHSGLSWQGMDCFSPGRSWDGDTWACLLTSVRQQVLLPETYQHHLRGLQGGMYSQRSPVLYGDDVWMDIQGKVLNSKGFC